MRVLGIDPGLTRCGLGVVEGSVGRPLTPGRRQRAAHLADLPVAAAAGDHRAGHRRLARRVRPRRGRRRAGLRPVRLQHRHGHRPGQRHRPGRAPPGAACRSRCTRPARSRPRSPAAAAPTRPRSARWSTRILRLDAPPKPADAADALALAITHIWRGGAQARIDAALAAQRAAPPEGAGHDRVRPRPGRRRRPHQRRRSRSAESASS